MVEIKIDSRYTVGDPVFFIDAANVAIFPGKIKQVMINMTEKGVVANYKVNHPKLGGFVLSDRFVFQSKEKAKQAYLEMVEKL